MPLDELHEKATRLQKAHASVYSSSTPTTDPKEQESLAQQLARTRDAFWTAVYHPESKSDKTTETNTSTPKCTQG